MVRQVEKLARRLVRWHATLHVGTFIGTFARKNEMLARFWHVGTQARWHVNHAGTQACWHVNQAGMQARWQVDHVGGTQARIARDLANPTKTNLKFLANISLKMFGIHISSQFNYSSFIFTCFQKVWFHFYMRV